MRLGSRSFRVSRLVGALCVAALGGALFALGCGDHGSTSPTASGVPLRVRVEFPAGASGKAAGLVPAATIDQVRAFAWEVVDDTTQVLRDQASEDIAPADTAFGLVLTVPPADLYRVRVEARGGGVVLFEGEAMVEGVGSGKTASVTLQLVDAQPPAAPTGLTATVTAATTVILSWKDNAENELRYRIERRSSTDETFAEIAVLQGSFAGTVTYTDKDLPEGTTFQYRVRAEGVAGFSGYSNVATVRTGIAAPTGLAVSTLSSTQLRATWNYSTNPGGFQLQRRTGSGAWGTMLYPSASARGYNDGGLTPLTAYGYRIRAFTGPDTSAWSDEATGTTDDASPVCTLSDTGHDFGTLETGNNATWSFTLTNSGGGTLAGTVATADCGAGFSLTQGAGPFSLTAGQSVGVTVRYAPATPGPRTCTVTTGLDCTVAVSGDAVTPGACSVDKSAIAFGALALGASADSTFTLTNTGGTTLSVDLALSGTDCSAFSLNPGPGSYDIGPGAGLPVGVHFEPGSATTYACTVTTGSGCTVALSGSGTQSPECRVTPASLDFGTIEAGADSVRSFQITNAGGGTLNGAVALLDCAGFALDSGGGSFALGAGASRTVTVRFSPTAAGDYACTVTTGTQCPVDLSGSATRAPQCSLSPPSLDFGTIAPGADSVRTFRISNSGGGTLSGTLALLDCAGFSFESGGGSFALGAGQSRTVTVRFSPTTAGDYACTVTTGTSCSVPLTGKAVDTPVCSVEPASLDFGTVATGSDSVQTVVVTNTGGGTLSGSAIPGNCAGFSVVSGGGAFNLGAGQSRTIGVRFAPTAPGDFACQLNLGTGCDPVPLSGTGELPPQCTIEPTALVFDTLDVETSQVKSFTITNTGGGTVEGTVALPECSEFTLESGAGGFSLGAGESHTVSVKFTPLIPGGVACEVTTGTQCFQVPVTGAGRLPPYCTLDTYSLDFGAPQPGTPVQRSFTITNEGGGLVTGSATLDCADFSIVSGSGPFTLGAGASRKVTVQYQSSSATGGSCTVQLGTDCGSVSCTAAGVPECSLNTGYLNFGTVVVGQTVDRTLTVTNSGGGTLTGSVTESCSPFVLFAPGSGTPVSSVPYSLGAGQSIDVRVRFQPSSGGTFNCTIIPGSQCIGVQATGEAAQCSIYPGTTFDMGTSYGYSLTTEVTITNTGAGTLTGFPTESCPNFSLTDSSYEGPVTSFALGPKQSYTFVVWFTPPGVAYGTYNCTVSLGPNCPALNVTAHYSYIGKPGKQ